MILRPYQRASIDAVWAYLSAREGNPAVVIPTGGGKSPTMAGLIREALERWPGTRIAVVAHVRELVAQNAQKMLSVWPEAPIGIYSASLGRRDRLQPIVFASIQSVFKRAGELGRFDLVLVDEAHRIPVKGEGMYHQFLSDCRRFNPELRVIGFTATPFRLGVGPVCSPENLLTEICYEVHLKELIEQGFLSRLISKASVRTQMDTSVVHVRGGEFVARELDAAVNREEIVAAACREMVELLAARRAWIVFCASVSHAEAVNAELGRLGVTSAVVEGSLSTYERDARIGAFQRGEIRALCNVNVLTEGFDATHVDAVVMLRPTKSAGLYCLDAETEILTSRGWLRMGEARIGDVALAAGAGQQGLWSRITGVIQRPMEQSEKWVTYEAPRANFRVTGDHRMLFSGKDCDWRIGSAIQMASLKDGVRMPTAVHLSQPGAPLTDNELYLIGIIMTDGSITTHQVMIYQSERYPEIIERIEAALNGAGIRFKKRRLRVATEYQERFPRWCFSVSAGDPRNGVPGRGIRYLYPFLDKDFSPALMTLGKSQFMRLLQGIWDGDGYKLRSPSVDWTPRGWQICSAREGFVNKLQALAVMNGCTANLRWEHGSRKNPIAILTIKDQDWRSVGGCGKRPQVQVSDATNEDVWCVETEAGTIVTRRRGKVTVMGNCQMVGRGLRLHPGKDNCIILDFAGNILEHGPVDAIRVRKARKRGESDRLETQPMKACPSCSEAVPIQAAVCGSCGHRWPVNERAPHEDSASVAPILSDESTTQVVEHAVDGIYWDEHIKPGSAPSMRVTYRCGMRIFREWVCVEHGGYARQRAVDWWRRRALLLPDRADLQATPRTVADAIAIADQLPTPIRIAVRESGKYPEIVAHEFDANAIAHAAAQETGDRSTPGGDSSNRDPAAGDPLLGVHELRAGALPEMGSRGSPSPSWPWMRGV